jgi:hypothetical protein
VDFGVEDGELQSVTGEPAVILAGDSRDKPVAAKPSQVVAGLVPGVGRTAEQAGNQARRLLLVMPDTRRPFQVLVAA